MTNSRKRRGRDSELILARWLNDHGYPGVEANQPGRSGVDILGIPGLDIEVKARRNLDLPAWLRQATRNSTGTPLLVTRLNGQGPADVGAWPAITTLNTFLNLWETQ